MDADEERRRKRREYERRKRQEPGGYRREYQRKSQKQWRDKKMKKAIEYKGGQCSICGYHRCVDALVFHHLDPLKKQASIGRIMSWPWERLKEELDKCVLLCANCHAEVHAAMETAIDALGATGAPPTTRE